MKWTDENIDKLFQNEGKKQSFAYRQEYWEEFSASLPTNTPLSEAPDDALDLAFQQDAMNLKVPYSNAYWEEFEASYPQIVPTETVDDTSIDAMYQEEAAQLSFEYHPSYWEEMAAMLRRRRRRPDFIWFGLSGVFSILLLTLLFSGQGTIKSIDLKTLSLQVEQSNERPDDFPEQNKTDLIPNESSEKVNTKTASIQLSSSDILKNAADPNKVNEQNTSIKHPSNEEYTDIAHEAREIHDNESVSVQESPEIGITKEEQSAIEISPMSFRAVQPIAEEQYAFITLNNAQMPSPKYKGGMHSGPYVQGLFGVSQALISPSDALSYSYGVGAGWNLQKHRWSFAIGANALLENYTDLHLTRSAKVYGFGADFYQYDLFYKRLFTAEMELFAGYSLGRHQFRFGLRPSYTFSSIVDVAELSMTSGQGQTLASNEERRSVYGFMEGIQQWGVKPSVGYAYTFPRDWTVGMTVGTEILPSINEDFINGVNNRLPIDGQLYLRKTLNLK
jgi:hypothetical protein